MQDILLHMNQDKYVFAQLVDFLDRNLFNYLVKKYGGDHYVKHFKELNDSNGQLLLNF